MSRAVMQQALEALEWGSGTYDRRNAAIIALKQALAEPEQGPVASVTRGKLSMIRGDIITFDGASIPLYAAPTPHKPQTTHWEGCEAVHPECRKQEPLAWMSQGGDVARSKRYLEKMGFSNLIPLYTAPTPRKPLTDYINAAGINGADSPHMVVEKLQSAIERAHGIGEQHE